MKLWNFSECMVSLLSNLVNNLAEGIHKIKLNSETMSKNVEPVDKNTKIVNIVLNMQTLKMI